MGLFDNLKKLTKEIGKDIKESGVQDDFKQFGKELSSGVKNIGKSAEEFLKGTENTTNTSSNSDAPAKVESVQKSNTIPELFQNFPAFDKPFVKGEVKETDKYTRFTMDIKDATDEEISAYLSKIVSAGYCKSTDVRYEKDNTYIIVDPNGSYGLNLVFHIKK